MFAFFVDLLYCVVIVSTSSIAPPVNLCNKSFEKFLIMTSFHWKFVYEGVIGHEHRKSLYESVMRHEAILIFVQERHECRIVINP